MSKQKYFVVNPWRKVMQVGETFVTESLHPSLANHVRTIPGAKEEEPKQAKK